MEHLNEEVDVLDNDNDSDIDIEIEDDTPEEDRGREPLANAEEVSDDELSQYSTKVQKRINEVNRKYHDERRAKEAIARQSAEAVNYAKAVLEENNRLKETLTWGEKALIEQAQQKLVYDTVIAEAQYKRAYEDNDSEALVMAQRELYRVQTEADQLKNYRPAQQNLHSPQVPAYTEYQQPVEKPRDEKAETWAAKNSWFGQDREMTNLAYAVHENLVGQGVDPTSDTYYGQIDKRMREVFPDRFKGATRNGTVVAPASRSTPSKKVTLSSTQVAIAKRLGVSLQDYARQVAKLQ
jgi:hypothetical protein